MNIKLAKKLTKDFPHVFVGYENGREPFSMFGFECGDGWEPIIRNAAAQLEPLIVIEGKKDPEAFKYGLFSTSQLKEKYGTMRWYLSSGTEEMYAITEEAESKSEATCEQCGAPGEVRGRGWLYCACLKHTKKEDMDNLEYLESKYDKKHKKSSKSKEN